jgi:hypothetical protein
MLHGHLERLLNCGIGARFFSMRRGILPVLAALLEFFATAARAWIVASGFHNDGQA